MVSQLDPVTITIIYSFILIYSFRVKKKDFSLEEIYTNKNFNKPPER